MPWNDFRTEMLSRCSSLSKPTNELNLDKGKFSVTIQYVEVRSAFTASSILTDCLFWQATMSSLSAGIASANWWSCTFLWRCNVLCSVPWCFIHRVHFVIVGAYRAVHFFKSKPRINWQPSRLRMSRNFSLSLILNVRLGLGTFGAGFTLTKTLIIIIIFITVVVHVLV